MDLGKGGHSGASGGYRAECQGPWEAREGQGGEEGRTAPKQALGGTLGEDGASQSQEPSFPAGHWLGPS